MMAEIWMKVVTIITKRICIQGQYHCCLNKIDTWVSERNTLMCRSLSGGKEVQVKGIGQFVLFWWVSGSVLSSGVDTGQHIKCTAVLCHEITRVSPTRATQPSQAGPQKHQPPWVLGLRDCLREVPPGSAWLWRRSTFWVACLDSGDLEKRWTQTVAKKILSQGLKYPQCGEVLEQTSWMHKADPRPWFPGQWAGGMRSGAWAGQLVRVKFPRQPWAGHRGGREDHGQILAEPSRTNTRRWGSHLWKWCFLGAVPSSQCHAEGLPPAFDSMLSAPLQGHCPLQSPDGGHFKWLLLVEVVISNN